MKNRSSRFTLTQHFMVGVSGLFGLIFVCPFLSAATFQPAPGTYTSSWLGNSFGSGDGRWVQDSANKIAVSTDGTLIAGTTWDEGGRCVGLYKSGSTNVNLLKETNSSGAWGWGTASTGVAVSGGYIYDATLGGSSAQLLTFSWTAGSIDTVANVGTPVNLSNSATGLAVRGNTLAVVYKNTIEVRNTYNVSTSLSVIRSFAVGDSTHLATDVAIATDGTFWVLAGNVITHYSATGTSLGVTVPGLSNPVSVAFDNQGRLMVCDNGSYQVDFFTISGGTAKLAATFGTANGILSGTPGAKANGKLFNLVGAGTDSSGNIYVGMSFSGKQNLYLCSSTAGGTLNWSLFAGCFVNNFAFDPTSDGQTVYSGTGIYSLNYSNTTPGTEQTLLDITLDTKNYPTDIRATSDLSMFARYPTSGHLALYGTGQYAGGFNFFGFVTSGSLIASPLGTIGSSGWAWDVDANGGVWNGDASGNVINYFPFQGWSGNTPVYNTSSPTVYTWPSGWSSIQRVKYVVATDTLYVSGYLTSNPSPSGWWGLMGYAMARYDGWKSGARTLIWTNPSLPLDTNFYPPKAFDVAGKYVFLAGVNPVSDGGPHAVHILDATSGSYLGALQAGPAIGTVGNVDLPYAVSAMQRNNGEYEIMVEEDYKAKQLLYRWTPGLPANGTYTLTAACAAGTCLDVYGGGNASGGNVDIYGANGNASQTWTLTNLGGSVYKLSPACAPGLCLNVTGGGSADLTNVDVETDNGSNAQKWTISLVNGGYTLSPLCATGSCLDVYSAGSANGTNVDIYVANSTNAQTWSISPH